MKQFPIVCVGGSAGGLDAYIRLLQNLPSDMGVAIVIVNHITLFPTRLHEILPRYTSMPVELITVFLNSLSRCWSGKLVAVIVSGLDGDGAAALCAIRDMGGTTIAQMPGTASEPDMPESAMASGCIDFVLSPEKIAEKIIAIARAESAARPQPPGETS